MSNDSSSSKNRKKQVRNPNQSQLSDQFRTPLNANNKKRFNHISGSCEWRQANKLISHRALPTQTHTNWSFCVWLCVCVCLPQRSEHKQQEKERQKFCLPSYTHAGFNHFCECKHTIQHSTTQQINHRHFLSKLCLCLRPLAVALQWPLRISTTHSLSELPRKKLGTAEQFSISRIGIAGTKLVAVKHHHTLILHSNKASKAERRVEWRRANVICKQWEERKEMKRKDETNCEPPHSQLPHT